MRSALVPTDHLRPRFHVRPPTGYVNDPNGPIFLNGRWHLYFQYVYDTPRTGPVVWGHATSTDLAHWQLHRPAISPDPTALDRDGCWSGNAVVADGVVHAFYSGSRRGHPYQTVVTASSVDGGMSFGPPVQAVPDPDPDEKIVEYRDPFVWRENGRWLMVVGAGLPGKASARLYESADLSEWRYTGSLVEAARGSTEIDAGDMWECPQLVSVGDRDALFVGTYDLTGTPTNEVLAITGTREGLAQGDFRVSRYDMGRNFYAASGMRDGAILWGWATEGRSQDWSNEDDWSGMITLPRRIAIADDGRVTSTPVESLQSLRSGELPAAELPPQFEAEITVSDNARIVLHCGDEHFDITVVDGTVSVDRDNASADSRAQGGTYSFDDPDVRTLRWFVDGSISELFTDTGYCSTVRFYPTTPPPWRLEISGAEARIWALNG